MAAQSLPYSRDVSANYLEVTEFDIHGHVSSPPTSYTTSELSSSLRNASDLREVDDKIKLPIGAFIDALAREFQLKPSQTDCLHQMEKVTHSNIIKSPFSLLLTNMQ